MSLRLKKDLSIKPVSIDLYDDSSNFVAFRVTRTYYQLCCGVTASSVKKARYTYYRLSSLSTIIFNHKENNFSYVLLCMSF